MLQVADAGGEKALRAQAQNSQQHAALVQEMYQIAESADPDTLISGYSINEYLEQLRDSHTQVCPVVLSGWYQIHVIAQHYGMR